MSERRKPQALIHLNLYIGRKTVLWSFVGLVACAAVYGVFSETLTMTAFYPSPFGAYYQLLSTNNGIFARDSGAVTIGTKQTNPGNLLTIGQVASPSATLEVNGKVNSSGNISSGGDITANGKVTATNISATNNLSARGFTLGDGGFSPTTGTLGYRGGNVQVYDGSAWQPLSGAPATPPPSQTLTVTGTNPECPINYVATSKQWSSATCHSGSCPGCTTSSGWSPSATAFSCTYTYSNTYSNGNWIGCGGSGPCNPTQWSAVLCQHL